jgi:GTPase SAR1 family protein
MGICIGRSNFKKINPIVNSDNQLDKKNSNNQNETSKLSKEKNKINTKSKLNANTDEESNPKNIYEKDDSSNNIELVINKDALTSNINNKTNNEKLNEKQHEKQKENEKQNEQNINNIVINNNINNLIIEDNKINTNNTFNFNKNYSNNSFYNNNNTIKIINSFHSENKRSLIIGDSPSHIKKLKFLKSSIKSINKLPKKDLLEYFKDLKEIYITLIGKEETGKSAFMIKVTDNVFEKVYVPSIDIECARKKIKYKDEEFTLNFFVTSGIKEYQGDYSKIFTESTFILVFYDTSVEGSFNEAKETLKNELKDYSFRYCDKFGNFIFVGNKIDIFPKKENFEEIRKYCKKKNFENYEISVKTGKGIKELMDSLYEKFYQLFKGTLK